MQISKLAKLITLSSFFFLLHLLLSTSSVSANPIQGNLAPDCSNATPSKSALWPPNHKFSTIDILGVNDPDGDAISTVIHCIKQDEPLNSTGDGNTEYDASGVGASKASVRQERKGNSNGRVYHISYIATDSNGARCGGSVQVAVPKSKKKTALDDGPLYDSVNNNNSNCNTANINNSPTALDQSISIDEDTNIEITLAASDPDQDVMTFVIEGGPTHGALTGSAPNFTYMPNANYHGDDSFTFKSNDGQIDSNTATVSISVQPINDIPVAQPQSLEINEDSSLPISLTASDNDSDSLSFVLISQPTLGTLSGTAPNLVYTPNFNFNGSDSFTFKANDGQIDSVVATVSIAVLSVNDAPIAQDQAVDVNEDESLSITLAGSDLDGDSLSYLITAQPISGTLSGTAPNLTYTPTANYHGTDSFTFVVNDGAIGSGRATVNITVNSVNDAPTVNAGVDQTITEGDSATLQAVASDSDGTITSQEWKEGTQTVGNALGVTLNDLSVGVHTFAITVTDNEGATASNDVTVTVEPKPNTAPVAEVQAISTDEDVEKVIVLTASDSDGDILTYEITITPQNGVLSGAAPSLIYTPNANFHGTDSFSFKVNDGELDSGQATISINVSSVNDAPTVDAGADQTITDGTAVTLQAVASDSDGSIVSHEWKDGTQIVGDTPSLTLNDLSVGVHNLVVTVTDNEGATDNDTVVITVEENPNTAPIAEAQTISTDEDTAKAIVLTGSDNEGDTLTYAIVSNPTNGTIAGDAPNLTYTPNANNTGSDSFSFTVSDGKIVSSPAIVSIVINPIDDAPNVDAGMDQIVLEGNPVTLKAIASDPDGTIVSYEWRKETNVVGNEQGLVLASLALGEHVFTILVTDNEGLTASDNVKITVQEDQVIPGSLSGKVVDSKGVMIVNAKVELPTGQAVITNGDGDYSIANIKPSERSTVTASRNGFLKNSEIIVIESGKETIQNIILSRPKNITTFNSTDGSTITTDGMTVDIPAGTLFETKSGEPYERNITIGASYFPITTQEGVDAFPGDTIALNDENEMGELTSFGFLKLVVTDGSGNEIELGKGQEIQLSIPADDSLDKPATIPFWYFDEDKGYWVEDGIATYDPVTNTYKTSVDTIATFNLDAYGGTIAYLEVCVVDDQGNKVESYVALQPVNDAWRKLSKTSEDGLLQFNGIVAESDFNLYAGALDSRLGDYAHNSLYIAAGRSVIDECIVVNNDRLSENLQVGGTVVDPDGNAKPNIAIKVFGDIGGQTYSTPGLVELTSTQSDSNGVFTIDFSSADPTALEVALLGDKKIIVKAEEGNSRGQKELILEKGLTTYDIGNITILENKAPVANAGLDQVVFPYDATGIVKSFVSLDGAKSYDPDGSIVSYEWREGNNVLDTRKSYTERSLGLGEHVIVLTVTDEYGLKSSDEVLIKVVEKRHELFANAGLDRSVYLGVFIQIESKGRSIGSSPRYTWSKDGETIAEGIRFNYTPTEVGKHTIKLTVTNSYGLQETDEMVVTVTERDHALFANAGLDRTVYLGELIQIESKSRSIGSSPRYTWSEGGETIAEGIRFNYTGTEVGTHTIKLTVTNAYGLEESDEMVVTVEEREQFLFANAGLDKAVYLNEIIPIQASIQSTGLSTGGARLRYKWTEGDTVLSESSRFNYTGTEAGTHTIKLTVTNGYGLEETDEIVVTVTEREQFLFANAGLDKAVYLNEIIPIQASIQSTGLSVRVKWTEGDTVLSEAGRFSYTGTELGVHTIKLTVTNTQGLEAIDEITVTVLEKNDRPTTGWLDLGLDRSMFLGDRLFLRSELGAFAPVSYQWAESNTTLSTSSSFFYEPQDIGLHNIELIVTDADGLVDSDEMTVLVTDRIRGIYADAGKDQAIYLGNKVSVRTGDSYSLSSTLSYQWTQGETVLSNTSIFFYEPQELGLHTYKLTVTDADGLVDSDEMTVLVTDRIRGTYADAGKDQAIYLGNKVSVRTGDSYSLSSTLSYQWTQGETVLSNTSVLSYEPQELGLHTFKLTVTDADGLTDSDEMNVLVTDRERAINADAGLDKFIYQGTNIQLTRGESYSLAGLIISYKWTEGDTVLSTSSLLNFAGLELGEHVLKLTITDSEGLTATDEVVITVYSDVLVDTIKPVITLNGEENISIIQGDTYIEQGAMAFDDRDGVITSSIVTTNPIFTTFLVRNHPITYTVKDRAGNEDRKTRTVRILPAGSDITPPVITIVGDNPVTFIKGDEYNDLGVTVLDNLDGTIGYSFSDNVDIESSGSYQIIYTATDAAGNTSQATRVVNVINDQSDTTPPVVTISSPALFETTMITTPTEIVGSVFDENLKSWQLIYKERGGAVDEFVVLAEGNSNVENKTLATLDPSQLLNGQYDIILRATDNNDQSAQENTNVLIDGDFKVGNFSISFEDLSIPTAGIPITITRTYDTRQRHKNMDFGQGWSLGFENIRVQENRTPGFGWLLKNRPGKFGIPEVCVESNSDNIVSVTLADGDVKEFKAKAQPECNIASPILDVDLVFEAIDEDNGAKLEALDNNFGRLVNGSLDDLGSGVIDPTRYKLTTEEGREIIIDQNQGVREIYEPEGENRVTITRDGITHSAGTSITFIRDTEDRITQILSPGGSTLNYSFTADGDLTAFTNRANETTTFTYLNNPNLPHYLEDIIDPRGIRVARNEYDDDGRLSAHIDADGNRIEYTHDIDGRTETVKDRNGNNTTFVYNDRGDVVAQTNAEGETTTHSYDEYGFELSRTDALGNSQSWTYDKIGNQLTETDALGNTTTSTYKEFSQFDTQTDALGRVVIDNYYRNKLVGGIPIFPGPLTNIIDANGNTVILLYNNQGLPRTILDVGGNASQTEYNSSGFITASIDALGVRADYTVDGMGNRLTETTTRTNAAGEIETLTTTHVYDAKDNLIQTTDALGNVSRMEYSSINKVTAEIEANGNRTAHEFDSRGNKVKTTFADGSSMSMTYDAENNKLTDTDRLGRTTTYVYDKVNRLIETILPDATPGDLTDNPRTQTEYDDAGRVSAAIDANGNRTTYGYDAAGRRTSVTDALGNTSTYAYDAVGNQTSFTDANGNTMSYEYDALDRRTKTTYADTTSKSVGYDALGRKISETDQAGVTTQFAYDALGRLTKVTDVQGNETSYGYDEQGNKISQTDAEGRVTKWAYDKLGRVVSRTLPLGQIETFAYDAAGNLVSKTDFNGQTTSYEYDVNNRRVKTTYADGQIDEVIYDAVGNRTQAKITDVSGTRTYSYSHDSQNRLISETQADGTVLEYLYDNASNRTQLKTTKGTDVKVVDYGFDSLNRLALVTDSTGTTSYSYDTVGNRIAINHVNGNVDGYVYDSLNRLTSLTHQNSTNTVLSSFTYTLDATGKRTKIVEQNGRVTDYDYDNLNRLISETINDATNGNYSASYTYDKVGNRTYETKNGVQTQFTYDDNDRLSQQGGTTYTYDDNGNTVTETLDGDSKTFTYNAKNQLSNTSNAGVDSSYKYNADGIRVEQTVGLETIQYTVDMNRAYAQVIKESVDNNATVDYTYGDDLISQKRGGTLSIYHYDGLGSTRALSDNTGTISDTYDYEAFGETLNTTGATENSYLYAGEQFDQGLDKYYLRARYYDQGVGRFTQQDTWMGNNSDPVTLHKYLYGNADPVNHIDPSGNFSLGSFGAALNTVGTLASIASSFQTGFIAGQFATGQKEFSARNAGIALLWAYAGSKTNLLTRPFQAFLRKSGCLSNSFSADTLVETKDGLRRIDLVKKGELVLSYNEITGENEYQPVMAVMKSSKRATLFVIELETGSIIEATAEHLIYADGKWTQAQFIKVSSELIDETGSLVKVRKTSTLLRTETVVDLTVKQNHNFFVSKDKVLVHNISPCEKAAQALAKAVPKGCTTNFRCDDFTVAFEKILLSKKEKFKGKRLCVKAPRNISNGAGKVISTNGHHSAVQVGELVFDNLNPNGVPYSEWASDLGLNEGHQGFSVSSENMTGNYNGCINK